MSKLAGLSLFVFLAACNSASPPTSDWMERTVYSHAAIGYSGRLTKEYETVIEQSQTGAAVQFFLDDLESSDPAIRLYGLLGLKIIDADEYPKYLDKALLDDTLTPFGRGGCIIMSEPLSSIAQEIDQTPVEELTSRYSVD